MIEEEGSQKTKRKTRYKVCGPSLSGKYHISRLLRDGEHWQTLKRGFFGQHVRSFGTYLEASDAAHALKKEEKTKLKKMEKYREVEI